jgi:N-acetylmuramoyl-L-alanine amidase
LARNFSFFLSLFFLCGFFSPLRAASTRYADLGGNEEAVLVEGSAIYLDVFIERGEDAGEIAKRYTGSRENARALTEAKGRKLQPGHKARIPLALLLPRHQRAALKALFPEDRCEGGHWRHRVSRKPFSESGETLWRVAQWFTGDGKNYKAVSEENALKDGRLSPGMEIRIPGHLLLPALDCGGGAPRSSAPPPLPAAPPSSEKTPPKTDAVPPAGKSPVLGESHPELGYGRDAEGEFAVYQLKAGEALYSAVVVHFTGLVTAEEVNAAAMDIARRSAIPDVTDIAIGFLVKIPIEMLLPQYLPTGHPRRAEYEALQRDVARYQMEVRASNLEGVHVILDAGHGGVDTGASYHGLHERDYNYDLMCRVHRLLSTRTKASVEAVLKNPRLGLTPQERRELPANALTEILTTPRYRYEDTLERAMHVNLRWYVANRHFQQLRARGVAAEKIVFLSIHADALHPSLQGSMAYVAGAGLVPGSAGGHGGAYRRFTEVRAHGVVSILSADKLRSQAWSQQWAWALMGEFRRMGLKVHPDHPVRDAIVRAKGSPWVPAVLRHNLIPTKMLLETVNLANAEDSERLRDPAFREKMALAIVQSLDAYYSRGGRR